MLKLSCDDAERVYRESLWIHNSMNDHKCTQFSGLNIVRITQRNSMSYYDILLSNLHLACTLNLYEYEYEVRIPS